MDLFCAMNAGRKGQSQLLPRPVKKPRPPGGRAGGPDHVCEGPMKEALIWLESLVGSEGSATDDRSSYTGSCALDQVAA
jgi:hypothetical protein